MERLERRCCWRRVITHIGNERIQDSSTTFYRLIAIAYERKYNEFSRIYQFAKQYLYAPSSAMYSCPLSMTGNIFQEILLQIKTTNFCMLHEMVLLVWWSCLVQTKWKRHITLVSLGKCLFTHTECWWFFDKPTTVLFILVVTLNNFGLVVNGWLNVQEVVMWVNQKLKPNL